MDSTERSLNDYLRRWRLKSEPNWMQAKPDFAFLLLLNHLATVALWPSTIEVVQQLL